MMQKYVAVLLVVMLSGLAAPAFAGDYRNTKLLPQSFSLVLARPAAFAPVTRFGATAGTVAFAPPQSGQSQAQPPQSSQPQMQPAKANRGGLTRRGKVMLGVGIGMMGVGGANVAYGAFAADPCSGQSGCISNAGLARPVDIGLGSALIAVGAVLVLASRHHRTN